MIIMNQVTMYTDPEIKTPKPQENRKTDYKVSYIDSIGSRWTNKLM